MLIGKNIRYLRVKARMTQRELADVLGYKSATTVQKWEIGENEPPPKTLGKLAKMFHCDVSKMMYEDLEETDANETIPVQSDSVRIKVYGTIPAGIPCEAIQNIDGFEDIPRDWTAGGWEYFGLKVKGDSMFPKYQNGDVIIARKQSDFESGQDCIVYVNGYDATLKRCVKDGDKIILQPLNPSYTPNFYSPDQIKIAGVVVEIRRKV